MRQYYTLKTMPNRELLANVISFYINYVKFTMSLYQQHKLKASVQGKKLQDLIAARKQNCQDLAKLHDRLANDTEQVNHYNAEDIRALLICSMDCYAYLSHQKKLSAPKRTAEQEIYTTIAKLCSMSIALSSKKAETRHIINQLKNDFMYMRYKE